MATVLKLDAHRRLLAILAADAVGYSRLMAIDDHETVEALDAARDVFRLHIARQGGHVIDMAGDSVLAVFDTAAGAVRGAMDVQAELTALARSAPADRRMLFRIGVHLGDVIEKTDGTVYGDGVNVAARLQTLAEPGSIVVSQAIQGAIGPRTQAVFVDLGEHVVKNIKQPVRAFACGAPSSAHGERESAPAHSAAPSASVAVLPGPSRRIAYAVVAAVLLILAAVGWFAAEHLKRPADVAAYSAADRRMTFAVLPFQAPKGDVEGERLALSAGAAVQASQEARFHWARVTPRPMVEQAASEHAAIRQLGSALDVHFLLRGTVARAAANYTMELAVIDADTERVLDSVTLKAEPAGAPIVNRNEIDGALGRLTYQALQLEVARAREKPDSSLDVRDLTFRAYVLKWSGNADKPAAYAEEQKLLVRALAVAPDDLLALRVSAEINLCECLRDWSPDVSEMEKMGVAAMDEYLRIRPNAPYMLAYRSMMFVKHRRYEEALLVAEDVLRQEPESEMALGARVDALLRLGRLPEALAASQVWLAASDGASANASAAAVHFALRDDTSAARLARKSISKLARGDLADPGIGAVVLMLAAAEARAGRAQPAEAALKDFYTALPAVRTISQIKGWLRPDSPVPEGDAFFNALRLAGVGD